jgi:predicted phosphodiesterase
MLSRFQYLSDLHLESYTSIIFSKLVRPAAPILCLAGDIGNPKLPLYSRFLEYCQDKWEHIFIVAGNHEIHNNGEEVDTIDERLARCEEVCQQWKNVHFLEKKGVYLNDHNIMVLGTTLWTNIPAPFAKEIEATSHDYRKIRRSSDRALIRATDVSSWHLESQRWLATKIYEAEESCKHVVVISHHMPSWSLIHPKYSYQTQLNYAYAGNCDYLMQHPVRAWIYGHTHDQKINIMPGGTLAAVNAYGYNDTQRTGFEKNAVLRVPSGPWPRQEILS